MIFDHKDAILFIYLSVCLEPTACVTLGIIHVLMSFSHKIVIKNHLFKQPLN